MDLRDLEFLNRLGGRAAVWAGAAFTLMTLGLVFVVGMFMGGEEQSKLGLKAACETVESGMSAVELYHDHFGPRGYLPSCMPERQQECGSFTDREGIERHYACPGGECLMVWKRETWLCRVKLTDKGRLSWGSGELEANAFDEPHVL